MLAENRLKIAGSSLNYCKEKSMECHRQTAWTGFSFGWWHIHLSEGPLAQKPAHCGQQRQGDGRQARFKNKISISNFPGSLPGRLLHLHFTAPGATIPLPDRNQEGEHKGAWCSSHQLVKASLVLSSKIPATNPSRLLMSRSTPSLFSFSPSVAALEITVFY